ncbi:hypothetical protein KIN20_018036 [Parelaphostrongylus tenuis]|uniref:Uncharacterized protein n=1 Tax=Parelaphostrongylus tenuis TaxID=148309 RepID=A0AAD5MIP8_PARTN|nr:hypothetical protein KIN20_018036 [Parelaphostrongylus tenuis]
MKALLSFIDSPTSSHLGAFREGNFMVTPPHIRQNRRQLLKKGQQKSKIAKTIGRSHFPASVMVWAGISVTEKTRRWSSSTETSK